MRQVRYGREGVMNLTSGRRISVADAAFPKCLVLLLDLYNLFSLERKNPSLTGSNNSISRLLEHIIRLTFINICIP